MKEDIDKIQANMHAPFGPMLMEFKMPKPYVDMLNTYGDKISSSEKKSKQLDWSDGLVGNVKQEHKIEPHVWQEKIGEYPSFFNWMASCLNMYMKTYMGQAISNEEIKNVKGDITGVDLHNSWIVNSIAGDFNPPHMHSGLVSAAGWTMVPESVEKDEEKDHAGWIEWLFADPHPLVNPKFPFKPVAGKVMFFPSWLQHQVYPFRGKGIRRSISFNVTPKYK